MAMDLETFKRLILARAMDRLADRANGAAGWMRTILQSVVAGGGNSPFRGSAAQAPFVYVDEGGGRRRGRRGQLWQLKKGPAGRPPPLATDFGREGPPGKRSGDGQESIGFQIVKDWSVPKITIRFGTDSTTARGGMTTLPSYMMGWELGIRYPTHGPRRGQDQVRQKPWLRTTIDHNLPEFLSQIIP